MEICECICHEEYWRKSKNTEGRTKIFGQGKKSVAEICFAVSGVSSVITKKIIGDKSPVRRANIIGRCLSKCQY